MAELTYPTVVGHRIVECTKEQQEAVARRQMTPEERIQELYQLIEQLEHRVTFLEKLT